MAQTSLWEFALETYAHPGMESLCLELQDNWGVEVTVLLWCLWLDSVGAGFDAVEWRRALTVSQRARKRVRGWRRLRRAIPKWPALKIPRQWVKNKELAVEYRILMLLKKFKGVGEQTEQRYVDQCLAMTGNAQGWCDRLRELGIYR